MVDLEFMTNSEKRKHLENISGSLITSKNGYNGKKAQLLIIPKKNIDSCQIIILHEVMNFLEQEGYNLKYSELEEGYVFTKPENQATFYSLQS